MPLSKANLAKTSAFVHLNSFLLFLQRAETKFEIGPDPTFEKAVLNQYTDTIRDKKTIVKKKKIFLPKYADTNTNTQTHPQTQQSNMRWWVGQTKKTGCEVN